MPYVVRDDSGAIESLHRTMIQGSELLPFENPEVQAFWGGAELHSFARMDAELVRVLEDLIDALIRRNVLSITDLPQEAQGKLFNRKNFREGLQGNALSLYGNGESEIKNFG